MSGKKVIAVVGNGFVGGSLTTVMSRTYDVYAYDKAGKYAPGVTKGVKVGGGLIIGDPYRHPRSIQELVTACEAQETFTGVYFVCLPTPMKPSGECDVTIVEGVLDELSKAFSEPASPWKLRDESNRMLRIAVVKSTVPPGTTARWNVKYANSGLHVVFNPEFLREASAVDDMQNQDRIILGGPKACVNVVKDVFEHAFPSVPIIKTSSTNAEMVKYVTNVHLAVKVALANEFYQICEALGSSGHDVDYDRMIEAATRDPRLGTSHWKVPGPMPLDDSSGKPAYGFGGSCFAKDINGLMYTARQLGVDPHVMQGAWNKNLEVRPTRDWEQLKGRAVSS